jgi:hypothetical protein
VNEEYLSKTAFDNLPRRGRLARRRWRKPGGPVQPCCNRMLARRSGAGTGIRARHVPDTSRNGGIDGFIAYAGLKRLVMITEVGNPEGPGRSDVDLWHREITVQGNGRRTRVIKIGFGAARSLDRYLRVRVRARHAQAWRWQLWLGAGQPGADDSQRDLPGHRPAWPPVRHRGVPAPVPAPLQPHLARPRRRRRRPHGAQRLDLPPDAPPLRRHRPQRASPPRLRPHHGGPAVTPAITGQKGAPRPGPPRPGRRHRSPCASAGPPERAAHVLPTCRKECDKRMNIYVQR